MSQPGKKLRVVPEKSAFDISSFDIPFKGSGESSPFRKGSQLTKVRIFTTVIFAIFCNISKILQEGNIVIELKAPLRDSGISNGRISQDDKITCSGDYPSSFDMASSKKTSQHIVTQNYLKKALKPIGKYTLFEDTQNDDDGDDKDCSLVDTIIDNSLEESFNTDLTVAEKSPIPTTYDPNDSSQSLFSSQDTVLSSSQVESYDESKNEVKSSISNDVCNLLSEDYNSKKTYTKIDLPNKTNTLEINTLPCKEAESIIKRPTITGIKKHWKTLDKRMIKRPSKSMERDAKKYNDTNFFGLPDAIGNSYKKIKNINDLYGI